MLARRARHILDPEELAMAGSWHLLPSLPVVSTDLDAMKLCGYHLTHRLDWERPIRDENLRILEAFQGRKN